MKYPPPIDNRHVFPYLFIIVNCSFFLVHCQLSGAVAQLGERLVRNEEVVGSTPISSTGGA
jgi:hypothetical protein